MSLGREITLGRGLIGCEGRGICNNWREFETENGRVGARCGSQVMCLSVVVMLSYCRYLAEVFHVPVKLHPN